RRSNDLVDFAGFSVPAALMGEGTSASGPVTASVRPQAMRLSTTKPADGEAIRLEGTVAQSAFLGETWDYLFRPASGDMEFKVVAPPAVVFQVGAPAWLQIDPHQIVPISDWIRAVSPNKKGGALCAAFF